MPGELHTWDVTPLGAREIQERLAPLVRRRGTSRQLRTVCGCDTASGGERVYAATCVLELPTLREVARSTAVGSAAFPYIPGLLSFRELPLLLEAWKRLDVQPDCVMLDGHGLAHTRRFGIACHMGVWLGVPAIGCAKTLFIGECAEPAPQKGSTSPILEAEEILGVALRSRENTKPVFVSVGHLISLREAVRVTIQSLRGFRIPEPIRQAHVLANELRRAAETGRNKM